MSTDANKPVQNLTPNTLASIQSIEAQIAGAASAAGVSELSIAEPIAREENKADVGDYGVNSNVIVQGVKNIIAQYGYEALLSTDEQQKTSPLTNQDYVNSYNAVQNAGISNASSAGLSGDLNRIVFPSLNDIGPAKIQIGTAMDAVNLTGTGSSATVDGGGAVNLEGTYETVTLGNTGSSVSIGANDIGETINGSGLTIAESNGGTANVSGSNNTINQQANSNSYIGVDGGNDTVTGDSGTNLVQLYGNGTAATVDGGGSVGLTGTYETVTLGNAGSYVSIGANDIGETINGSGLTAGDAGGASFIVTGNNNNIQGSAGDTAALNGTNDSVNGLTYGTINLGANSSTILTGDSSDTINLTGGVFTNLSNGSSDVVNNAATGDTVLITNGTGVTINGSGSGSGSGSGRTIDLNCPTGQATDYITYAGTASNDTETGDYQYNSKGQETDVRYFSGSASDEYETSQVNLNPATEGCFAQPR